MCPNVTAVNYNTHLLLHTKFFLSSPKLHYKKTDRKKKWPCLRLLGSRQCTWRDSVPSLKDSVSSLISQLLRILIQQFRSISRYAKNPESASEFAAKRPCLQRGLCFFDIRFNITAKWPCLLRGLCLFSSSLHIQRLSTHEFLSNSKPRLQRFQQYILDSVTVAKWQYHGLCLFDR